jgi:hypothetical protein
LIRNGDGLMGSSKKSLDNLVRFRHKLQNIAIISAVVIGLMSVGLLATTYQMSELNKRKIDEMAQHQDQIKMNTQMAVDLRKELDESKTEIDKLKMQLTAEKSIAQSLKVKLTDTLKLLAQTQVTREMEATNSMPQSTSFPTIPSEDNFNEKVQRPLQNPTAPITSSNNNRSIETDANNQQLNSQVKADPGGKKDASIPTKPTALETNTKKSGEPASPDKASVETSTPTTIEPPPPDQKMALPSAESMEVEPTQSSASKAEIPANQDPDNVSLE